MIHGLQYDLQDVYIRVNYKNRQNTQSMRIITGKRLTPRFGGLLGVSR